MPKRLLIITQKVDEADDLLGFFVAWLREFARHFERVDVITLGTGSYAVPANVHVHSLGKERGVSKLRRFLGALPLLWRLTPRRDAVFAHMSPIFAIVAWPFAVMRRARLVLWYLHRSRTLRLRLALALSDRLVTADASSLTIHSPKIVSVGHGIDTERFAAPHRRHDTSSRPLRIISVGRLSPIKDFATLIHAAALLRDRSVPVEVRIVGRSVMPGDRAYERTLHDLVARLGIGDIVHFVGFVPYRDMPVQYAWADVVVGCTPTGGLDKAVLEGMAAGCVALTSNDAMRSTLGVDADRLVFRHGDPDDLAGKLGALDDMAATGERMTRSVQAHHGLQQAIDRIAALL